MYEVIWSWFSDAYVYRPINSVPSTIKPKFIGTREQCAAWISNHE